MRAEFSEKEVARRLQQASRLRRLCLSLGRASAAGLSREVDERKVTSEEPKISPGTEKRP